MDAQLYNKITNYCKGKLVKAYYDRHLEDLTQYVAMRIWETSQKGAHQKWEWAVIDYLRINGIHQTKGKLSAKTLERSLSIDAPGPSEDSNDSNYLLDQESISRSVQEDESKHQDDSFKGVLEVFLAPLNLNREVLKWTLQQYRVKTNLK